MATPQPQPLQLAHLLSDLSSLLLSDPAAALALVSARANTSTASTATSSAPATQHEEKEEEKDADADADIQRAKELVELHYAVKEAHRRGELGAGLEEARASVARAVGG